MSALEPHRLDIPVSALPDLPRSRFRLVLDQVRSAYNTGAIFRTADAGAVERIYLLGLTPHPPHAQVEKTALGATTYVPWLHRHDFKEIKGELRSDEYTLVALDNGTGAVDLGEFRWPPRTALVAGNEVEGVSSSILAECSHRVSLPMYGYKRSLNVTTAIGIALYDYLREHPPKKS